MFHLRWRAGPRASVQATARPAFSLLCAISLLGASSCARVMPYERGALAHPTMSAEDVSSSIDEHVRALSEGATGGVSGGGGGCGCN